MAKIDLASKCRDFEKTTRIGLVFCIVFALLDVFCIVFVSLIAQWQYQIAYAVIGSIVASCFGVMSLFFFLSLYLPARRLLAFYKDLLKNEETEFVGVLDELPSCVTTFHKGVSLSGIKVEQRQLFLLEDAKEELSVGVCYRFWLRGKFIVGEEKHESQVD